MTGIWLPVSSLQNAIRLFSKNITRATPSKSLQRCSTSRISGFTRSSGIHVDETLALCSDHAVGFFLKLARHHGWIKYFNLTDSQCRSGIREKKAGYFSLGREK